MNKSLIMNINYNRNPAGKGGFVVGRSGNPGGRKRELPLLERDIEGRKTLKVLYKIRDDESVDVRVRASVCTALLPHLIGSPRQSLQIEDNRKPTLLNIGLVPQLPPGD